MSAAIDPRSDAIVLFYNGGPTPRDVPARDLHGGDLARILYVRAHVDLEKGRPVPATPAQLEALATDLSSSGSWAREAGPIDPPPAPVAAAKAAEVRPALPPADPALIGTEYGPVVIAETPEAPAPPAEPEAAS